jgi:hypothetical protein
MQSKKEQAMQNKIKRAQASVAKAQELTRELLHEAKNGGSYVAWKLAVAEQDAAEAKLNTLLQAVQA